MPVRRPVDRGLVPRPDYYPSYAALSPEQKWIYLNWLTDVTQPVDVGYAFLYYYGLERHLLLGHFESAFDEILVLQQRQGANASLQSYSHSALLSSALFRGRPERLKQLYELHPPERFQNMDLVLAHQLGYDLGPEGLIRVARSLPGVNKRYVRKNPEEYERALTDILSREFGHPFLPLASAYSISEVAREPQILFANISFPSEIRCRALPSFLRHEPFIRDATRILGLAHEETKCTLAAARKRSRSRPV